ncbi:MAG TPA: hypothetical protein VF771_14400 [Longimicrobiaceae bacterium]
MKKLHLEIAALRVESFEPLAEQGSPRGTVGAREATQQTLCTQYTCGQTCDLNDLSCNNQETCYGGGCPLSQYPTCYPVCRTGDIC